MGFHHKFLGDKSAEQARFGLGEDSLDTTVAYLEVEPWRKDTAQEEVVEAEEVGVPWAAWLVTDSPPLERPHSGWQVAS